MNKKPWEIVRGQMNFIENAMREAAAKNAEKKVEVNCECGQVYDPNGQLDRSAADYADGLPDATCEEDEQITDRD